MNLNKPKCQFKVFYQPVVCLTTGKIGGFEALLRWRHPSKGYISPVDFIPIAEETGLIIPLGTWVLKTAINQMSEWQQEFFSSVERSNPLSLASPNDRSWQFRSNLLLNEPETQHRNLKMAVNISGKQFLQLDLVAQIEQMLQEAELNPSHLKLEITESLLMENFEQIISILKELSQLGIELAIDDFGTGYSSLGRLQTLPINTLKIDRCFVSKIDRSLSELEIVKAIANMAAALKIKTVVEGIETPNQLTMLQNINCHQGQGYYFAKPLDPSSIIALLKNVPHWMHHFTGN